MSTDNWTFVFIVCWLVAVFVIAYIIQKHRSRKNVTVYISDFHVYQR